jgi:hypothetical protein
MAQVDSSIYLQQQAPDITGSIAGGLKLKDMIRQNKAAGQAQEYNDALKSAYAPDPVTGQLKFDPSKLSSLAQIDPQKAYALQQQQKTDAYGADKMQAEQEQLHHGIASSMLGSVNSPEDWARVKPELEKRGYFSPGILPAEYDKAKIGQFADGMQDYGKQKAQQKEDGEMFAKGLQRDPKSSTGWSQIKGGALEVGNEEKASSTKKNLAEAIAKPQEVAAKIQENSIRNSERKDAHGNQQMQQVQSMLESARGNPEVMQAQNDRYAADKLNGMLGTDPNKLSPQMVQLAASEVAKIATGGVPQSAELQHLTPSSLPGSLAQAAQYFTNSPNAANQGAFLQQYQKYANDLKDNANNVIKDKYSRVIESRRASLGKDNADTLTAQYLDPLKNAQKQSSSAGAHPQDDQAVAWAKSNMNDPRSVAILKANGVK